MVVVFETGCIRESGEDERRPLFDFWLIRRKLKFYSGSSPILVFLDGLTNQYPSC